MTVEGLEQYVELERRLALLGWLNQCFGYDRNRELLHDLKNTAEGFGADGRSYMYHALRARGIQVHIPAEDLARYDDNIREHLEVMNARRPLEPITLRYFQYLAVLYTEVFLDWYFERPGELLRQLNDFVEDRTGETITRPFSEEDLKKLAFWMATGSGKTLVMHLNYRQFLHYHRDRSLDNILLITPNEGLSAQHIEEMQKSGIPCDPFDLNESGGGENVVQVIEITKLVQEKTGEGESVPVEAFEGNNLIFVDEGHKGSGGEAWRAVRDALGETGFTFEYSATFGQALTAARNDELTREYGKAIIFDYSYRYFYDDGYGKDFHILNLEQETTDDKTDLLLMGNLLSFYEQQRVFEDHAAALKPYNLEKPLWIFVGKSVNAVFSQDGGKRSDVFTVVRFLHRVLGERNWAVTTMQTLLGRETGLNTPENQDVFCDKFRYLRKAGLHKSRDQVENLYDDVLARVLRAPAGGNLHLCWLKGRDGEIGLKTSGSEAYFGLIYIGDASAFKKLVEEEDIGVILEEDVIANSLFGDINKANTSINVLIGAKKFMEGWSSWRVSNMGLLNIGRKAGSEIIQLFGRGVRLRGLNRGLKRSAAITGREHPDDVKLLETLNIFSIRANYMSQFREYLEREGVELDGCVVFKFPVQTDESFLQKGLVAPRTPDERSFVDEADILLEPDDEIRVPLDLSVKLTSLRSSEGGPRMSEAQDYQERSIPADSLALVDWERAFLEVLDHKEKKHYANLAVRPETLREIISHKPKDGNHLYRLVAEEDVVNPTSFAGAAQLQKAVTNILRGYVDKFYRSRREQWDKKHMVYRELDKDDPNLGFNRGAVKDQDDAGAYVVSVKRSENALIQEIQQLIEQQEKLYGGDSNEAPLFRDDELPRFHFDRHIYQPLLVDRRNKDTNDEAVSSAPPGLNRSEKQFVDDLVKYWKKKQASLSAEVFLLRNMSRGRGVGFFEYRGFYPDFILWIVDQERQHVVFVEPHGMIHAAGAAKGAYKDDEKATLHERLPDLEKAIANRSKHKNVTLDSYIISATSLADLRDNYENWSLEEYAKKHILFFNPVNDYIDKIFTDQLKKRRGA